MNKSIVYLNHTKQWQIQSKLFWNHVACNINLLNCSESHCLATCILSGTNLSKFPPLCLHNSQSIWPMCVKIVCCDAEVSVVTEGSPIVNVNFPLLCSHLFNYSCREFISCRIIHLSLFQPIQCSLHLVRWRRALYISCMLVCCMQQVVL